MNIRTILCPTDFSELSRQAQERAAAIAQWYNACVIPLHVQEPALETVPATADRADAAVTPGTRIGHGASPAEAIVDFAASENVDLIVMGTHGIGGFRHLILGSVTEVVLRKATCPVVTVSPHVSSTWSLPFKRLLCAVDFSSSSLAALELASDLARDSESRLDIVHVIDEPEEYALFVPRPYDVHHHPEVYERHVREHLERVLPPSAREPLTAGFQIVRGTAEDQILQTATENCADLIVIGVGRQNDPAFGSTVNHVVRNARCLVMTVRGR